ncbi:MAG: ABC transporter permease [Thermoguttaceae bacterium]|nr:ABC transporter permease [Thermoguttaceae bacterium]
MSRLSRLLVFSRLARHKRRLVLVILAIAAAACLVVWVIGGYRNLYTEIVHTTPRPFGRYDVMIGAEMGNGPRRGAGGGGPAFGGPLAKRPAPGGAPAGGMGGPGGGKPGGPGMGGGRGEGERPAEKRFDPLREARAADGSVILGRLPEQIPSHMRERLFKADTDGNGALSRAEEETLYDEPFPSDADNRGENAKKPVSADNPVKRPAAPKGAGRPGMRPPVLSEDLLGEMARDELVRSLDRMRNVRAFVFAKSTKIGGPADIAEVTHENGDTGYEESVPEGIDPELHRRALAAYRACMGTPMGLGEILTGTDAPEPPAELEEGRWFGRDDAEAREAVLGAQAAKRFNARAGDPILVLTKTDEYQLKVVGILDDQRMSGFYVPIGTAGLIAGGTAETNQAGITLISPEKEVEFQARWQNRLEADSPGAGITTKADYIRIQTENIRASSTFRAQAVTGTILAILASLLIVLAALSIDVEERRREIGLLRAVGVGRTQIALSILTESFLLAVPGWLGGLFAGWLILRLSSGKEFELNRTMVLFSFFCAVLGSMAAAIVPIMNACRIRPLEAVSRAREIPFQRITPAMRRRIGFAAVLLGLALIAGDLFLIYGLHTDLPKRAAIHSAFGVLALALGVLCLIPVLVRLAESLLLPLLAWLFRFERTVSAKELSAHMRRTTAVAAMLAIGGGLFTLMQIWGYSMLGPFLPNGQMPDAFAAFLPAGLTEENAALLREIPLIRKDRFEPVAVEQAAFAPESTPNGRGGEFANVVFFGMDVDRGFAGPDPLVKLKFIEGNPASAYAEMKSGRGVLVNDALTIDYGFKLGDTLRLCDPKQNSRILEYPIVGIVSFNGWQWLSKTGGVRRNYGRSGGMVFASDELVRTDYHLTETGYFWFDLEKGADRQKLEAELDRIARKNHDELAGAGNENTASHPARPGPARGVPAGNAAYVKLSTRESLSESISKRADGVIWGLSTMPLVTLSLMSIALVAVTVNSVQTRRRTFGILRAVGVERGKLTRMILAESILLALCAAAASLMFGIPAAAGALKLGQSMFGTADPPLVLPVRGLSLGLALLVFLAAAAAVVPAVKIGLAKPLDLLREE